MDVLFDDLESWKKEWEGMPEFIQHDFLPFKSIIIHFNDEGDIHEFSELINQKITTKTKYINFPKKQHMDLLSKVCSGKGNPKYPIYVPTKGRWESLLTIKALERINVPYKAVIEKEEYNDYASVMSPEKILVLPFSNKGLFNTRKWIMEHSIKMGAKRHWQIDDNISDFYRLNRNIKYRVDSGLVFKLIEDFSDRYTNVAISGMQYEMFVPRKRITPPFILNTRVYSISLINNSIPHRHRRLYNDDTDICLCALKDGWCTILFQAFLADKKPTMTMKGGNTEELYLIKNGRLKMTESLIKDHPDVVKKNLEIWTLSSSSRLQ